MTIESISQVAGFIGLAVGGGLAIIYFFDINLRRRQQFNDKTEERVIDLLKEQVNVLERKVNDQEDQIKSLAVKVDTLTKENHLLRDVLQGRDKDTQAYQAEGRRAFKVADEALQEIKVMGANIQSLMKALDAKLKVLTESTVEKEVTTKTTLNPIAKGGE